MVPTDLVGSNKELCLRKVCQYDRTNKTKCRRYFKMVIQFRTGTCMKSGRTVRRGWHDAGRSLEGFGARQTLLQTRKIDIPRGMNRCGVTLPVPVHLLYIICVCAICKEVIRGGCCETARLGQRDCRWKWHPEAYAGEPTEDATR